MLWGQFFLASEHNFTLGKAPKFGVIFQKFEEELLKIRKITRKFTKSIFCLKMSIFLREAGKIRISLLTL